MFYLFHHIPKCGGQSFGRFLKSVFQTHPDYPGGNAPVGSDAFLAYQATPLTLETLTKRDCVLGHYNVRGILLPDRYPNLERLPHRKFSILRDPWEAAQSGLRYGMAKGRLSADMPEADRISWLLKRGRYYSRCFGIRHTRDIDDVFRRYWFIAPLDRMDHVAAIIEAVTGRNGTALERVNETRPDQQAPLPDWVAAAFREQAELDYALYERAKLSFGKFSAKHLL